MYDTLKELLNQIFSKDELIDILIEILKKEKKTIPIYSYSPPVDDLLYSKLEEKCEELLKENNKLLEEFVSINDDVEFYKKLSIQHKISNKIKLTQKAMDLLMLITKEGRKK